MASNWMSWMIKTIDPSIIRWVATKAGLRSSTPIETRSWRALMTKSIKQYSISRCNNWIHSSITSRSTIASMNVKRWPQYTRSNWTLIHLKARRRVTAKCQKRNWNCRTSIWLPSVKTFHLWIRVKAIIVTMTQNKQKQSGKVIKKCCQRRIIGLLSTSKCMIRNLLLIKAITILTCRHYLHRMLSLINQIMLQQAIFQINSLQRPKRRRRCYTSIHTKIVALRIRDTSTTIIALSIARIDGQSCKKRSCNSSNNNNNNQYRISRPSETINIWSRKEMSIKMRFLRNNNLRPTFQDLKPKRSISQRQQWLRGRWATRLASCGIGVLTNWRTRVHTIESSNSSSNKRQIRYRWRKPTRE